MLMIKELSGIQIGNWIAKYVNSLAKLISASWMHLYEIDLSSNKEFQNVSIFLLYCSWAYDTIHKFLNKIFQRRFVDSFGCWCITALLTSVIKITSVIKCTSNVSQIKLRFSIILKNFRKLVNCTWGLEITVEPLLRYCLKCS